ncbi:transposase [Catenulispora sp. GAS73]
MDHEWPGRDHGRLHRGSGRVRGNRCSNLADGRIQHNGGSTCRSRASFGNLGATPDLTAPGPRLPNTSSLQVNGIGGLGVEAVDPASNLVLCSRRRFGHDGRLCCCVWPIAAMNGFAVLRLLPMSDRDKDAEILALRHQLAVLQRQLGSNRVRFAREDRAFLAALLKPLPRDSLRRLHLIVSPDTVLRWHRDLMRRRHANTCRPRRAGRPRTVASIRRLVLRLVRENPSWGYRRAHGELATLGIKIAASTVWEILKDEGIDPAPERTATTWAAFLRSQAEALLACDFIETVTLTGQRQYILAVIEHVTRRVRVLGTTAHPTAAWVAQAARNLVIDLEEAGATVKHLIRDRDAKFPPLFDEILGQAGIEVVLSGIRVPRMNSVMERWVQTCRHELLDRTLTWNQGHLLHALHEYETHYNSQPCSPSDGAGRTTTGSAHTDHRPTAHNRPQHTPTRPTRRHRPRVPTRSLTCLDDIIGRRNPRLRSPTPRLRRRVRCPPRTWSPFPPAPDSTLAHDPNRSTSRLWLRLEPKKSERPIPARVTLVRSHGPEGTR